ncbi:MAG: CARDB domain-containing protein [Phycisphaerales bacterium]
MRVDLGLDGKLRGRVTDSMTGQPLAAATVTILNPPAALSGRTTVQSDAEGKFEFDDMPDGDYDLRMASADPETHHEREYDVTVKPKSTPWVTAQLHPKGNEFPKVIEVSGKYCSPERRGYYFHPDYVVPEGTGFDETFRARIEWGEGNPPGEVAFVTPRGTFAGIPTDASLTYFEREFNMEEDFGPFGTLQVIAIPDEQGAPNSEPYDVNMKVLPFPPGLREFPDAFVQFGNVQTPTYRTPNLSVKVRSEGVDAGAIPSTIPVVGSMESKLGFSSQWSATIKGDGTADAVGVVGAENTIRPDTSGAGPLKLGGFAFNAGLGGGAAWNFREHPDNWSTGGTLRAQVGFSASFPAIPKQQVVIVGPVPIPFFWQAKGDIGVTINASITGIEDDFDVVSAGVINCDPLARFTMTGAVGLVDIANLYIQGSLGVKMRLEPMRNPVLQSAAVYGAAAIGYQFMSFKQESPIGEYSWSLLNAQTYSGALAQPMSGTMSLVGRDYLSAPGGGNQFVAREIEPVERAGGVETPFQLNVFNESAPAVVVFTNNDRLMVWQQDDPARSPINRTKLVWSYFTASTQTWSAPANVANDGTADGKPRLARLSNGNVLCVWQDVREVIAEPVNPLDPAQVEAKYAEYKSKTEISTALFTASTRTWGASQRLTDNLVMDHSPRVSAATDGTAAACWTSNPTGHEIGSLAEPSSISASIYSGGTWGAPGVVAAGVPSVFRTDLAHATSARTMVVYSGDTDADVLTDADRELFTVERNAGVWGAPLQATANTVPDSAPAVYWNATRGAFGFVWTRDGDIVDAFGNLSAPRTAIDFDSTSGSGASIAMATTSAASPDVAIVWQDGTEGHAADLYAAFYESAADAWSKPRALTQDAPMETMPAVACLSTGDLFLAYNKTAITTQPYPINVGGQTVVLDMPKRGNTDLYTSVYTRLADLVVTPADIVFDPPNPVPGDQVTIRTTVRNEGDRAFRNLTVVLRLNGTVLATLGTGLTLPGSKSLVFETPWTVPPYTVQSSFQVTTSYSPAIAGEPTANNSATVLVGQNDAVVLSMATEQVGPSNWMLVPRVYNAGSRSTGAATQVVLRDGDATGPIIATLDVPVLAPGAFHDAPYLWEGIGDFRGSGPRLVTAVVDPGNLVTEFDEDNNVLTGQINPNPAPPPPPPPACRADFNTNGVVDTADLVFFLGRFGQTATPGSPAARADFNGDGVVNTPDLVFFLGRFGSVCP